MKAIVYETYGSPDVLELREVDNPELADDRVLVRVRASSANPYDWHFMRGTPYFMRMLSGLRTPKFKRLGADLAGEVETVGRNVTRFRPGDEVFGMCRGAFAEYVCAAETALAVKPSNLTFEQAAAVPLAATTALQGLRDAGRLEPGHRVLVIGAGGGVGTFAVQIAKLLEAHVTGVCSTSKMDLVRSLGADHVIDYTKEDFVESEEKYDLVFQLAGTRSPSQCRAALTPKGTLVLSSGDSEGRWIGPIDRIIAAMVLSPFVSQRIESFVAKPSGEDLEYLKGFLEAGRLKPVIDRVVDLSEVAEAIRHLEEGHTGGKIVIRV